MEHIENHIDDLIGKYLAGEATDDEVRFVQRWIAKSQSNEKYFNQVQIIFKRAAGIKDLQHFDTDAAWNKVREKLQPPGNGRVISLQRNENTLGIAWKIAASIIVAFGIGFFAFQFFNKTKTAVEVLEVASEIETQADTLPDGSNVFLNKQTTIAYAFDEKQKSHIVKLKGEAYFSIKHNEDKKFIVEVDGVFIKDIGTSFNVKAYPESNTIEVVVEEGEVMFYTEKDSGVYLRANGKGIYNKITKEFTIENPEPNVAAYKTKTFIFTDTELGVVEETLNAVYKKKIIISEHLKGCRLTVTFNNERIEEIAQVIAETVGGTITTTNGSLLLEGGGCGD